MLPFDEIDRTSHVVPFRQIAHHLREAIRSGTYPQGGRLPSESELMRHFGVARMTVRQAIAELQAEGLVIARHGRGVFAKSRPPVRRLAADRFARRHRQEGQAAFLVEALPLGRPSVDEIDVHEAVPPAHLRELLGLPPRGRAVVRSRRYLIDGHPVELATSYVPSDIARGTLIAEPDPGPGGIYARLEESGHLLAEFVETVATRMPTSQECRRLELGAGEPVLLVVRQAIDDAGRVVEVCDTVKVGSGYLLEYRFSAL